MGGSSVTISWGASSDPDGNLAGYVLECSLNGGGYTQLYQGGATAFAHAIARGWRTLAYRVRAYDSTGLYSSYRTSGTMYINSAPDAPGSITVPANVKSNASIAVTWPTAGDPDGNLAGYRLERSVNGGAWSQVYQGAATSSSQAITFGWNTVAYRVRSYDTGGLQSGYTTSPTRTVYNEYPPTVPASISVPEKIYRRSDVTVTWGASTDPNNNLAGYILEWSRNNSAWEQIYQGPARTFTQYLTCGWDTVAFRVKAYDHAGQQSGYRSSPVRNIINTCNITKDHPPCMHISSLTEGEKAQIVWGDQEGAQFFVLERSVNGGAFQMVFDGKGTEIARDCPIVAALPNVDKHYSFADTIPIGARTVTYRIKCYNATDVSLYYTVDPVPVAWLYDCNSAVSVPATQGDTVFLTLEGNGVRRFDSIPFTMTYDASALSLENLEANTEKGPYMDCTPSPSRLTMHEQSPGKVVFTTNQAITPGGAWSGLMARMRFRVLKSGAAQVHVARI